MRKDKGRVSISAVIGLLLCLTLAGAILRHTMPAADSAGNYQSSEFSWPEFFPDQSGILTYSAVATTMYPVATKIDDKVLQLKFARPLESVSNNRDGAGYTALQQTYVNFSISGTGTNDVNGLNADVSRYENTYLRRIFDVVEITTTASIQTGETISYSYSGKENVLGEPNTSTPRLLAAFNNIPFAEATGKLNSVTVNGVPAITSSAAVSTLYETTVDPDVASVPVELSATAGSIISYMRPQDSAYRSGSSFSMDLTEGFNVVLIQVTKDSKSVYYSLKITRQPTEMRLASATLSSGAHGFNSTLLTPSVNSYPYASYSFADRIPYAMDRGDLSVTLANGSQPPTSVAVSVNGGSEVSMTGTGGTYSCTELPLGFPTPTAESTPITVFLEKSTGITPTRTAYNLLLYRVDTEAYLTGLEIYARGSDAGSERPLATNPPFDPSKRGNILLTATPGDADTSYYQYCRIVPTANPGTDIKVDGVDCQSGQPGVVKQFPAGADELRFEVTLSRLGIPRPTTYTVVVARDRGKAILKSLVVSKASQYREYPDVAPVLMKLGSGDLATGNSWTVNYPESSAWEAYIFGDLHEDAPSGTTVAINGKPVDSPASFKSGRFSVGLRRSEDVEIKVTDPTTGRENTYKLHLVNNFVPVERIYLGVPPEVLADARDPLDITVDVNGIYSIPSKSSLTLIGLGLSFLSSTTQPHRTEFEIPWSVWPPNATDRDKVQFNANLYGITLSVKKNEDGTGGSLKFSRVADSAFYSAEKLKEIGYVERIKGPLCRAYIDRSVNLGAGYEIESSNINAHRKVDYNVDLSFKTTETPSLESYVIDMKAFELFPGNVLPILDPWFPHSQIVVQEAQSLIIPISSHVPNWGAYKRLPAEMQKKFPIVYPYKGIGDSFAKPFSALYDELSRRYNGQIPNDELEALDARLIDYSYAEDGFSFALEWPAGMRKIAEDGGLGKPSDYLTVAWDDGGEFANAGARVTCIKKPPTSITGMLPVTLTAKTKITGQSDSTTIMIPCNKISKVSQVDATGAENCVALIVSPRTYAFWKNDDIDKTGKMPFVMAPNYTVTQMGGYNHLIAGSGVAIGMAVVAFLDIVKEMLMDILVTEGDVRVVWKNLAVNQPITYYTKTVNLALRFHNNDSRTGVVSDGIMWSLYNNGFKNNGTENQLFTPYGDLDKSSGSTYPGIFGNLTVLADNESARRFFDAHPYLLPLVSGDANLAKGRFGPYELKVSGESVASFGMTPVTLTGSVLFVNLDPIDPDPTKGNSRVRSKSHAGEGIAALNSLRGAPGSRMASLATESEQLLYIPPFQASSGDFVAFHDATASVKMLVSLGGASSDDQPKNRMSASTGGMIECVVPMIGFADNIIVSDVNGNLVNSSFDVLESNVPLPESEKGSTSYKKRKAATASSSGAESFIIQFEVPSMYLEQVEIADIYFRREGSPFGFEVAKLSGKGINGGFTISEHGSGQDEGQDETGTGGGGGCDSRAFGAAALAFAATLIAKRRRA